MSSSSKTSVTSVPKTTVTSSKRVDSAVKKLELKKRKQLLKLQHQFDEDLDELQTLIDEEQRKPAGKKRDEAVAKLERDRQRLERKFERNKKQVDEQIALELEEVNLEEEEEDNDHYQSFDEDEKEVISKFRFPEDTKFQDSPSDKPPAEVQPSLPPANDCDGEAALDKDVMLMTLMRSQLSFMEKSTAAKSEKFLPEFAGDAAQWGNFKSAYDRSTDKFSISNGENLGRLQRALKGKAKEIVEHMLANIDNVPDIMKTLEMRYGRPEFVLDYLVEKAKESKRPDLSKPETIVEFGTCVQALVTSIKSYKRPSYMSNTQLVKELAEKLPGTMKGSWFQFLADDERREPDLGNFSTWLEKKVRAALLQVKPTVGKDNSEEKTSSSRPRGNLGSLHASVGDEKEDSEETRGKTCPCCQKRGHGMDGCWGLKKKSRQGLWKIAKEARVCYCCLKDNHTTKDCPDGKECGKDGCTRRHHPLLHFKEWSGPRKHESSEETKERKNAKPPDKKEPEGANIGYIGLSATIISGTDGPLPIVPVRVQGPGGIRRVHALLDSGCTRTLITKDLAEYLELDGPSIRYRHRVMQGGVVESSAMLVNFEISGSYKRAKNFQITDAVTIGEVGLAPYSMDVRKAKEMWPYLGKYKGPSLCNVVPEVVIGGDHGFITMDLDLLYASEDKPVGRRTALGWYLQGKLVDTNTVGAAFQLSGAAFDKTLDKLIVESFKLDEYGETEGEKLSLSKEDEKALEVFEATTKQRRDGRWEVGLPFKNDDPFPKTSYEEAFSRLRKTEARMKRNPEFAKLYNGKFGEYTMKGFLRRLTKEEAEVKSGRTFYLSHFGVVNPHKPGKFRLVFDCAAKIDGRSFNDHLLTGPDLIRPITSVLWNFRKHRIVICGDIEDMFHRIYILEEDRQAQRLLWRYGDDNRAPDVYEMKVMIFGATSSPACAIFVKDKNARQHEAVFPEAVDAIINNMYVDDLLFGAETAPEAVKLRGEIMGICGRGGFMVKKWMSNSDEVLNSIPEAVRLPRGPRGIGETERVLGLYWSPEEDIFTFKINFSKVKPEVLEGRRPTKREMCSLIMSLFDPLGFVGHFKIKGMILFQSTWKHGTAWDDPVPDEVYYDWRNWVGKLKELEGLKISRCYSSSPVQSVQLHTFVDSSAESSCAVSYFRFQHDDGSVSVSFVGSKTRVAPKKKLTIPRLELCAALLGAQLADKIKREVKIKINKSAYWSDSATVLSWIGSESARFKEFVANRITKIQKFTKVEEWRWVPTAENVADEGTRLRGNADLRGECRWIRGPEFLKLDEKEWPRKAVNDEIGVAAVSAGEESLGNEVVPGSVKEFIPPINRFSCYYRMVRATAACIAVAKFLYAKAKKKPYVRPWKWNGSERVSMITTDHMLAAEKLLIRVTQEDGGVEEMVKRNRKIKGVRDEDGLVRVEGRLGESVPEALRAPIVLPSKHHLVDLLVEFEHKKNEHSGRNTVFNQLRQKYWLLDGRHAVRRCWSKCLVCRLKKAKPVIPEMGLLPSYRVAAYDPPFTYTGCDLFGPIEVTVGRHHEKRWGMLFTCMVTRGVHLEVINGLSVDETLLGISRFVDTRGLARHFYSDNGTNFQAAGKEVVKRKKFYGANWHFIPPASPHMGGAWESMVKQVKKVLAEVMKEKFPKDQTLLTALKAVENVVNSRPLAYVSSDPDDPACITPNHFLRGIGVASSGVGSQAAISSSQYFGEGVTSDREKYGRMWEKAQLMAKRFWERWSKEVLPDLLRRNKWNVATEPIRVGDIVILVDDLKPRNEWSKAVVTKTFPASDGSVRKVEASVRNFETKAVKTYLRAVAKVCPTGLRICDLETNGSQIRGPENVADS